MADEPTTPTTSTSPSTPETPAAPAPEESTVWEGSPSQWTNFGTYLLWGVASVVLGVGAGYLRWGTPGFLGSWSRPIGLILAVLLVVPLFVVLRTYLLTRTTKYKLTTERILSSSGILSRRTDNLELYRVDDLNVLQPFFLRLVGRADLVIVTSDRTTPELKLAGLPNTQALRDEVRKHVEICRDRKRTRVVDMDHF